jgi:hypothetical protein
MKMFPSKATGSSAIGVMTSILGIIFGIAGLEHGFFEILQGNVAPEIHWISGKPMIYAIGEAQRFWPYGFEYAYTVIPNFLITGILAILVSSMVILWSVGFVQKKHGWLVFLVLSTLQYLVGGGAAQYGPAIVIGLAAFWINSPLKLWRGVLPIKLRQVLAKPWLWLILVFAFVFCHSIITAVFGFFYGVSDPNLINQVAWGMLYFMMALLPLMIISAFASDSLAYDESGSGR